MPTEDLNKIWITTRRANARIKKVKINSSM
jgi:hypothetical protein